MPINDPLVERTSTAPRPGVAIALSGGGYRAMLFHLGALWRMGQLGFFEDKPLVRLDENHGSQDMGKLERISSVSGGSITSCVLALAWTRLEQAGPSFDEAYRSLVAAPVRNLASMNLAGSTVLGAWPVLKAIVLPGSVNEQVARAYDRVLFGGKTLQDLPDRVRFIFNASNLQSGSVWRFSKPYMRDWRVGKVDAPRVPLAEVVAASSAFPPVLAPAMLNLRDQRVERGGGEAEAFQQPVYTREPALADGGVYDNLGLESCFKQYRTLFVSNAGKPFTPQPVVRRNWASLATRCIDVMDNQVLSLRKRMLIDALKRGERHGAFWDIQQNIATHPGTDHLACLHASTIRLAQIPTDLAAKDRTTQDRLINWGYAAADAAICEWFRPVDQPAPRFPYPDIGV